MHLQKIRRVNECDSLFQFLFLRLIGYHWFQAVSLKRQIGEQEEPYDTTG